MDRNYCHHFDTVLEHCSVIRLWATHQISPLDICRAQECHGRACQSWARMHCHLTPNFHLSEHNEPTLLRLGPLPSWWGFTMEQHNGFLKSFRHNGHTGGKLESTIMRGWWKYSLLSDLVCLRHSSISTCLLTHAYHQIYHLRSLDNPTPDNNDTIKLLEGHVSGKLSSQKRGAFLGMVSHMSLTNDQGEIPPYNICACATKRL